MWFENSKNRNNDAKKIHLRFEKGEKNEEVADHDQLKWYNYSIDTNV